MTLLRETGRDDARRQSAFSINSPKPVDVISRRCFMAIELKAENGSSIIRFIIATLALSLFVMINFSTAEMQAKNPYDKERLLRVVRLNALSTQEIIQAVEQRGVDFQTTTGIEEEF